MPPHIVPMMRSSIEAAVGDVAEFGIVIEGRSGDVKALVEKVTNAKADYKILRKRFDNAMTEAESAKLETEQGAAVVEQDVQIGDTQLEKELEDAQPLM